jgi:hypothetical protein
MAPNLVILEIVSLESETHCAMLSGAILVGRN